MDQNIANLIKNIGNMIHKEPYKLQTMLSQENLESNEIQKSLTNLVKLIASALQISPHNVSSPINLRGTHTGNSIPLMGPRGPRGLIGDKGEKGEKGEKGIAGDKGEYFFQNIGNDESPKLALKHKTSSFIAKTSNTIDFQTDTFLLNGKQLSTHKNIAYMFQWDEVPDNIQDFIGRVVYLSKGNRIKTIESLPKRGKHQPIGIIPDSMKLEHTLIMNTSHKEWNSKYIYSNIYTYFDEENGEVITSEIEPTEIEYEKSVIKKLNPNYDESRKYHSRLERQEWIPVIVQGFTEARILKQDKINSKWSVVNLPDTNEIMSVFL